MATKGWDLIMSTELVEIPKENAMTVFTQESGLDSYVKQVADEVAGFKHDMKTAASRGRTISLSSKVAKIKVMYDNRGKDLVSGWKESAKKVDASRKKMRDELDELRVLARKPVTDWEEEQEEIEQKRLAKVAADMLEADKLNDHEVALLLDEKFNRDLADAKLKAEADRKAEEQRLEDIRIANNARIASEAREEANRVSKKAIDDANAAKQKAIDDKAQSDKDIIEHQARAKVLQEQAEQDKLRNDWLNYISEAYEINNKIDQDNHYKLLAEQAETRRLADVEAARLAEIKRQADVAAKLQAQKEKIESDNKHVGAVRGEIKRLIMAECGLDETMSRKVVRALLKTQRITINY
jgi:colicin import membrane protein